jgi:hypothetical protein
MRLATFTKDSTARRDPAARRAYSPGVTEFLASAVGLRPQHPSYYVQGVDADPVAASHFEGTARQVSLTIRERNPYARQACIKHYGCRRLAPAYRTCANALQQL